VAASSNKKLDFLTWFFDLNEEAFAYHRHCLGSFRSIDPMFLKTLDVVANELFIEIVKQNPDTSRDFLKSMMLKRRATIQSQLDFVSHQQGCSTREVNQARVHYNEFSQYTEKEILNFIAQRTGD